MGFEGEVFAKGDSGYEEARRGAVWNALVPDRFPELIVRAASEGDCVEAVRTARERGLKVSVRSGGTAGRATTSGTRRFCWTSPSFVKPESTRWRCGPVRRAAIPEKLGPGLARHCAEEYANLNAILPGLYQRFSR